MSLPRGSGPRMTLQGLSVVYINDSLKKTTKTLLAWLLISSLLLVTVGDHGWETCSIVSHDVTLHFRKIASRPAGADVWVLRSESCSISVFSLSANILLIPDDKMNPWGAEMTQPSANKQHRNDGKTRTSVFIWLLKIMLIRSLSCLCVCVSPTSSN